jgi:hypothetical protein
VGSAKPSGYEAVLTNLMNAGSMTLLKGYLLIFKNILFRDDCRMIAFTRDTTDAYREDNGM